MIFTDLRLQQYRSYKDASFELGPGVNIVVGPNGAGKTNLLEAIMVGSAGKSYRARDGNLLNRGQKWARIDLHTSQNTLRTVKLEAEPDGRIIKTFEIDDKIYKRLPAAQKQPLVLFEPNDLRLIGGEPSLRRDYFDDIIESYLPEYSGIRKRYQRTVSQRNALLKQPARANSQLFAWNLRLVELGERLTTQRRQLLRNINQALPKIYSSIAGKTTEVEIHYDSSVNKHNYGTNFLKKLEAGLQTDLARGFTGHGPHRDDFTVYINDEQTQQSASRGEVRTLLLALKIIELQLLENAVGVRPLLLLDDVFSELDGARRRALTEFLKDYQCVITTTDADAVIQHFSDGYSVIPVQAP